MEVTLRHFADQDDFYHCDCGQAAFVGGLGYGKTMTAADWIITSAAEYPELSDELFIFSNTYSQLQIGTLRTLFEQCDEWGITAIDRVRFEKKIKFPEFGAEINVRSEDRPINFKSLEIARAWIDEAQAYKRSTYEKILGRMRGSKRQRRLYPNMPLQIRLTANPPHDMQHWLTIACTVPDPATGKPPIHHFTAATYDNPFLTQDYIDRMTAMYDPELADIEMGGKFGSLGTGKIWRSFDRRLHVLTDAQAAARGLPPLRYDATLPLCWGQDFNLDPLSTIFFQFRDVRADGYQKVVMYVLGEMRIRDSRIEHAVKEFVENRPDELAIARRRGIRFYGDATGESQSNRQTGESDYVALRRMLAGNGLDGSTLMHKANPLLKDRYNAGNAKLIDGYGRLGVVIRNDVRYLPLDLEGMVYKIGTKLPDEKKKLEDGATMTHAADAWSYAVEYEFPMIDVEPQMSNSAR